VASDPLSTVHPSWARALAPVEGDLARLEEELAARRAAGEEVLPAPEHVLRAFTRPLDGGCVLLPGRG